MGHSPFTIRRCCDFAFPVFLTLGSLACRSPGSDPFVVLIGLDGATPSVIDELRSKGKLPNFERLVRRGAHGPLQSVAAQRVLRPSARHGFFSPIVWTSIATGQVPEDHGVLDFVLPVGDSSTVWMGAGEGPSEASLTLPELSGNAPLTLHLRLRSHGVVGEQNVRLFLNDELLGTLRVPPEWTETTVPVPVSSLRPAQNQLRFHYARRRPPVQEDRRALAVESGLLRFTDAGGAAVLTFDPVLHRYSLGHGFHLPTARATEVQSLHWRAKPLWLLLGEIGLPAGIIGYWGTWPAYPVEGFLVSSRMGIRDRRHGSGRLTWPPELAERLEPLAPRAEDLHEMFDRLHVSGCEPRFVDQKSVLKKILVQDELYARIAESLLPAMERGFASVYFRSIDVASHVALHYRHGAPIPEGCPESLSDVTDAVYVQVDTWIGRVLDRLPERATVVVVSDHGMAPLAAAGGHAANGVVLAAGEGIRRGAVLQGATVLDVAPTLLYLLRAPIPFSMDGKVLVQMLESEALSTRAPVYREIDTSLVPSETPAIEPSEEILEELRALGYLEG
jgi:predicted AlkP superfamily phosphohydrolase/phosphomutase